MGLLELTPEEFAELAEKKDLPVSQLTTADYLSSLEAAIKDGRLALTKKEQGRLRFREWFTNNRDKQRARDYARYHADPEAAKARVAAWRATKAFDRKARYANDPDYRNAILAANRDYWNRNKDRIRNRQREYRKRNKDHVAELASKRYAGRAADETWRERWARKSRENYERHKETINERRRARYAAKQAAKKVPET